MPLKHNTDFVYKIISDIEPYAVAVTYPNKTQNCVNLYKGYTQPTGDLVIPETVFYYKKKTKGGLENGTIMVVRWEGRARKKHRNVDD